MSTFKLGIILVILIGVAYFYKVPLQEQQQQNNNFLSKIEKEKIQKIEIAKDGSVTILEKVDDKLKIEGTKDFYVDDKVAQDILDAISDTKEVALNLVSNSQEKKSEFKTDDTGIEINIVQEGEDAVNFVVGKLSDNFKDNYISIPSLPETYSIASNLVSIFNQGEWRSKRIFKTDVNSIAKLRFQRPDGEFIVEKIDDEWKGTSPIEFKAEAKKVEEVLDIMSNMTADSIPEQKFEGTGLEQNLLIVQATGDGVDNTIMVGVEIESEELFYVKKGDSDNIYLITKEDKVLLDRQIADLTE